MKELLKTYNEVLKELDYHNKIYFNFKPHNYQWKFLNACLTKKRVVGIWSRQSGKSTCVGVYSLFKAITVPGIVIIMTAPNQRQSKELYSKVRNLAMSSPSISSIIVKSTETELMLENNSRIVSLPCGPDGAGIRGFTGDIVIVEEAGKFKNNIVNAVVMPMLASKKSEGQLIKIGTPLTRNHFYDSCFIDKEYEVIKVDWKMCVAEQQYSQDFIDEQRRTLTDLEFKSEYEAEFVDEAAMFFPIKLLELCEEDYSLMEFI